MQLNEFPYFASDLINLRSSEDLSGLRENQSVSLMLFNDGWMLKQEMEHIHVSCPAQDRPFLTNLTLRDQTRWMLAQAEKNTLQLQYLAPVEVTPLDLQLGVDGLISDDLFTKQEIKENDIELAIQWLQEHFVVTTLSSKAAEEHWLAIARFSNSGSGKGFQLLGKGWRADVEAEKDGRHLIRRITRHLRRDSGFSLLTGSFSFQDASATAALNSATHKATLDAALRDNGSYIELWNLYNDKEWANALKQAETLKALRFTHAEAFEDGRTNRWRIWPKSSDAFKEFRERWQSLDIQKSEQVDLSNQAPDWAEELSTESKADTQQENARGDIRFEEDHLVFTPLNNRKPRFEQSDESEPKSGKAKGGWLYLSLAGQRTIAKRRVVARQSIDSGKRMPQLKSLLEGVSIPSDRRRKIKGLTPYAKETFKGGKPTEKQLLALETALNTPDVAIIIGPPGTGKTQVIAALQRRLAEEFEEQNLSSQVLVSSFQHDAVDNALDRSQVFNLPATRVGGKKGSAEEESGFGRWVDAQAQYLNEQIDQQYQQQPILKQLDELNASLALLRVSRYSPAQYAAQISLLLKQLQQLEQHRVRLPSRLISEFEDYVAEQQNKAPRTSNIEQNQTTLRFIRGVRTTPTSFADDGSLRAYDLLRELKRQLYRFQLEDQAILEQAAQTQQADDGLLQLLEDLQNRLLDHHLPDYRPPELKQALDNVGVKLLDQIESALDQQIQQHKQGIAWALQELANSIETDRQVTLATTEEYAMVVGATCQQAAGNKMASLKSVAGLDSSAIDFDTVVIDEAARANPLDLFIPMSMARRRIILVGDDRQLPHMLEPDIEGQLQEEHQLTALQLEAYRISMFERMRSLLRKLQQQDGTMRVVMLDTQFRMHPVLGDFVSQQFYESMGMDKVKSGRPASDFAFEPEFLKALGDRQANYNNKVCQWIDVPASEGTSIKQGTSRIREAEAERIADEVKVLFEAAGNNLSIGVITFYAAQRELIMEKLASTRVNNIPLMKKVNGEYEPSAEFATTSKGEEGLRVGSVDAFQGKEFDVVLLSCVRTWHKPKPAKHPNNSEPEKSAEESLETQLNRMFGFLRLPNRMNVAMSRQRQMLICVGDAQLATNPDAKEGVPALQTFYQLCGGNHGSLR